MQQISKEWRKLAFQLCLATLSLCLACPVLAQDESEKEKEKNKDKDKAAGVPARREEAVRASMTAKVTAINPEKREITLKGSDGKEKTLTVDKAVKRFDEIKVGDNVNADYYASLALEVREPTAEEKEAPLSDISVEGKSPSGSDPAAGSLRQIKAITKVEELDPQAKTVTIKGPRGRTVDVAVKDPAVFQKLKKGDSVVITFTEAVAIELEKQNGDK